MIPELKKLNLPILYTPGNTETQELIEHIKNYYPEIHLLDNRIIHFNNEFIIGGLGGSLDHIGSISDFELNENIFNKLVDAFEKKLISSDPECPKMLIFQESPRFLRDKSDLKKLQRSFRKKTPQIVDNLRFFGSSRLYESMVKINPSLVINGHCHEYLGEYIYKNTKIVNPGALATFHYAVITINGWKNPKMIQTKFYRIHNHYFSFTNFIYRHDLYFKGSIEVHN